MADVHYAYGVTDWNGRAAARIYLERFPNRRQPSHILFGQLHGRWREWGAFEVRSHIGREHTTRSPVIEETVLQAFAINTQTNLWASERVSGAGRSTIMFILCEECNTLTTSKKHRHCALTIIPSALDSHAGICNSGSHSKIFHRGFCFRMNPALHRMVSWTCTTCSLKKKEWK